METFFHMGGYAPYIWSSYGLALLVLVGLLVATLMRLRNREATLRALEQGVVPKRRRRNAKGKPGHDDGATVILMAGGSDARPMGKGVNDGNPSASKDTGTDGSTDSGGGDGGGGE